MKYVMMSLLCAGLCLGAADLFAKVVKVQISFVVGRPRFDCLRGVWFCDLNGSIEKELGRVTAEANYDTQDGTLTMKFNEQLPASALRQGYFYAEAGEEIKLPEEMNRQIGKKVQIKVGKYPIDLSNSTFGTIRLDTE